MAEEAAERHLLSKTKAFPPNDVGLDALMPGADYGPYFNPMKPRSPNALKHTLETKFTDYALMNVLNGHGNPGGLTETFFYLQ